MSPHHTFIPGISKQVISGAGALLAALIRDGKEGCGGHRLRAAAVVAPLVCTPRGLGVNTASAAAPLGEGRRSSVPVGDVLGLLRRLKIHVFEIDQQCTQCHIPLWSETQQSNSKPQMCPALGRVKQEGSDSQDSGAT